MIGTRHQLGNLLDGTAQPVGNDDARRAKARDQPDQKAPCRLGVSAWLNKDVQHVAIGINRTPEPVLFSVDRNHGLIKVPFVVRPWPVAPNAGGKMHAKTIDPEPDRFAADQDTARGQNILDIRRAQGKPVVQPDRVGDDLTRMAKALQAWRG